MSIVIVDYDAGNIGSIKYALEQCNIKNYVATHGDQLEQAERIILPGVGSFNKAMNTLKERKLDLAIKKAVLEKKIPILGICLGMQLFATQGDEGGLTEGLDLISGTVSLLQSTEKQELRLPHVGWNELIFKNSYSIFSNIPSQYDFYFLHSYQFVPKRQEFVIAQANYGTLFTAAIMKDNIIGLQFHPEKSGKMGKQILQNFASL